jgi:hypothetical protein
MTIYETDTDRLLVHNGTTWARFVELGTPQTWTPTVTQSGSVTATINEARFIRQGRAVDAWFNITATASGTAGNVVTVSLPVAYDGHATFVNMGAGIVFDSSTTTRYMCSLEATSTTTISFVHDASGNSAWGVLPNLAIANGDVLRGHVRYTVAAG